MNILGLETSTEYAVWLLADENGQCCGVSAQRHDRQLSARLYSMLDAFLADIGTSFDQIDAFAVGLGPGSFTGVRVAVTTMRTLAQVTGKPLVGIPTLDIYAEAARRSALAPDSPTVAALLPSRRDEVYIQIDAPSHAPSHSAASAVSYAEARALIRQVAAIADARATGPAALLTALLGDAAPLPSLAVVAQEWPDAPAFARLAADALRSGKLRDPLSLDPMYVAPPAVSQHKTGRIGP